MKHVEGFVLAVPKDKVEAYRKLARRADKVWLEHGALSYMECVADDVSPGGIGKSERGIREIYRGYSGSLSTLQDSRPNSARSLGG